METEFIMIEKIKISCFAGKEMRGWKRNTDAENFF